LPVTPQKKLRCLPFQHWAGLGRLPTALPGGSAPLPIPGVPQSHPGPSKAGLARSGVLTPHARGQTAGGLLGWSMEPDKHTEQLFVLQGLREPEPRSSPGLSRQHPWCPTPPSPHLQASSSSHASELSPGPS